METAICANSRIDSLYHRTKVASRNPHAMKRKPSLLAYSCFVLALTTLLTAHANNQPPTAASAANQSAPIPMDQLGAVAGKQYQGDGLSVIATPDGATLRCAFQRLEGQVTREGLWLSSTADNNSGERFRVMAMAVGRAEEFGVRRHRFGRAIGG